eukprot:11160565-Alexandrium_andersonii.AAC.1
MRLVQQEELCACVEATSAHKSAQLPCAVDNAAVHGFVHQRLTVKQHFQDLEARISGAPPSKIVRRLLARVKGHAVRSTPAMQLLLA